MQDRILFFQMHLHVSMSNQIQQTKYIYEVKDSKRSETKR